MGSLEVKMSKDNTYSVQEVANMFDVTKMSVYNRINANDPEGLAESIVKKGNFQRLTDESIKILSSVWELQEDEDLEDKNLELENEIADILKDQIEFLKGQIENKDELLLNMESSFNEQLKELRLELDVKNQQITNLNTSLDKSLKVADQFQSLNLVGELKQIESKEPKNKKTDLKNVVVEGKDIITEDKAKKETSKKIETDKKIKDKAEQEPTKEVEEKKEGQESPEEPAKKGFFASLFGK